jgi:hypothetical protein
LVSPNKLASEELDTPIYVLHRQLQEENELPGALSGVEKARTVLSKLEKQEKNLSEINKLKEDIESLTNNLKVIKIKRTNFE